MRVIVAGAAVDSGEVARAIPRAVTVSCADYSHAFAELQRGAGLVVTVASFSATCSTSGITLAGQARARGVPCVIVDRHAEDGMMGAAGMMPGGAGLVVTVASFSATCSTSGITLAGQARARGVPCVIVDRHAEDGMMGAAGMMPGGDLADAVRRANALRPVK